jgi:sugar O-acyltransferase (sialic acid O-acetyltransferase NeuD family)
MHAPEEPGPRQVSRRVERIFLIGAGGHGKVVLDALVKCGKDPDQIIVSDSYPALAGREMFGLRVTIPAIQPGIEAGHFHVAIGDSILRRKLYEQLQALGSIPLTIIHPAAVVSALASIEPGAFIAAQAVIGPCARIGAGVIVNHGAVVDHDCAIGGFTHIAPNSTLCGGVRIGAGVLIGAGANVLPEISVGDGAIIGAGAVVVHHVAAGTTCVGVPAAPIKRT